jgi:hypothetical protein
MYGHAVTLPSQESIFDRMLGFTYCPGPLGPKTPSPPRDSTFTYYNCTEAADKTWICFQTDTVGLGNARVCSYSPSGLHGTILKQKLGGPVTILEQK